MLVLAGSSCVPQHSKPDVPISVSAPGPANSGGRTDAGAGPTEIVVYDPNVNSSPRVKMLVGRDRLSRAASDRILDRLFGRGKYLIDATRCKDSSETLEQSRRVGNFAPQVFQAATGSFTIPGSSQTLYLVTTGECGAPHADNFGSVTLAVMEGDNVVIKAMTSGGSSIRDVVDLDGDGVEEIVLASGTTNMGSVIELVSLVRFERGKLVTAKDFGKVYEDNCEDPTSAKRTREYHVIRALVRSGPSIEFVSEPVKEPCR
jgi:hypothetical protein